MARKRASPKGATETDGRKKRKTTGARDVEDKKEVRGSRGRKSESVRSSGRGKDVGKGKRETKSRAPQKEENSDGKSIEEPTDHTISKEKHKKGDKSGNSRRSSRTRRTSDLRNDSTFESNVSRVRKIFGFDMLELIDNCINMVGDIACDGIDASEEQLRDLLPPSEAKSLNEAFNKVMAKWQTILDLNYDKFELYCLRNFIAPADINSLLPSLAVKSLQTAANSSGSSSQSPSSSALSSTTEPSSALTSATEEEEELDAELDELRQYIAEDVYAINSMKIELQQLQEQLESRKKGVKGKRTLDDNLVPKLADATELSEKSAQIAQGFNELAKTYNETKRLVEGTAFAPSLSLQEDKGVERKYLEHTEATGLTTKQLSDLASVL